MENGFFHVLINIEPSPARDSGGWALNHHGIWDSHIPEVFAKIVFSADESIGRFGAGATLIKWERIVA